MAVFRLSHRDEVELNRSVIDQWLDTIAPSPWPSHAGSPIGQGERTTPARARHPLYSTDERARRDASPWTLVQGVLAPLQFLVFAISIVLVVRFLATGEGYWLATASIVAKTLALYLIMVTGSIWEKEVFGKWLFARPFFWEDVFSMVVIALHTLYVAALITGWGTPQQQMLIAIAAYAAYLINAAQFLLKLREARLEAVHTRAHGPLMRTPA